MSISVIDPVFSSLITSWPFIFLMVKLYRSKLPVSICMQVFAGLGYILGFSYFSMAISVSTPGSEIFSFESAEYSQYTPESIVSSKMVTGLFAVTGTERIEKNLIAAGLLSVPSGTK